MARLLNSERRRLVEMNTGHWPMFSRPHEPARVLLDPLDANDQKMAVFA
ncbi:hypothetical protein ACIBF6_07275 [Streptosporangium amethystogenes]